MSSSCGREDEPEFQVNRGDPRTTAWTEILTFIWQESFTMNPCLGSLVVASSMNDGNPQPGMVSPNQQVKAARQKYIYLLHYVTRSKSTQLIRSKYNNMYMLIVVTYASVCVY